jgi:exocyst complex component 6
MFIKTLTIVLSDKVQEYLVPSVRQASYAIVKPKRLQALFEELAKFGASAKDPIERDKGERRRKVAEAVGRLFPGESRH